MPTADKTCHILSTGYLINFNNIGKGIALWYCEGLYFKVPTTLESVTSAKYLGVTFTNKLQWDQHINCITSKANKTLGFLRRNLKIPSISIKEQAYFTLARPLVEYANLQSGTHIHKLI